MHDVESLLPTCQHGAPCNHPLRECRLFVGSVFLPCFLFLQCWPGGALSFTAHCSCGLSEVLSSRICLEPPLYLAVGHQIPTPVAPLTSHTLVTQLHLSPLRIAGMSLVCPCPPSFRSPWLWGPECHPAVAFLVSQCQLRFGSCTPAPAQCWGLGWI